MSEDWQSGVDDDNTIYPVWYYLVAGIVIIFMIIDSVGII